MYDQYTKNELEKLIGEKRTIGKYYFNEKSKIFTTEVEVVLIIKEIEDCLYRTECYFFDGYEVGLDEDRKVIIKGNVEEVKRKAIESWNEYPEKFMNYPIVYLNVSCEIQELDNNSA